MPAAARSPAPRSSRRSEATARGGLKPPEVDASSSTALAYVLRDGRNEDTPSQTVTTVVPLIGTATSSGSAPSYRTLVGFGASNGALANFSASFYQGGTTSIRQTIAVPAGTTRIFNDVVGELFGLPASTSGTVFVQAPSSAASTRWCSRSAPAARSCRPRPFNCRPRSRKR